jgi:hypothetical protein
MKYYVGGVGWEVRHPSLSRLFLPPSTLIDDSLPQWAYLVGQGPPIDCIPLDQATYNFMTSNGVIGLGFPYWRVAVSPGIVPIEPQL